MKCLCGCGLEVPDGNSWIRGHVSRRADVRARIGAAHKGKKVSALTRSRISRSKVGVSSRSGARVPVPLDLRLVKRKLGLEFSDELGALLALSAEHPSRFIARVFGVTVPTIHRRMDRYGISRNHSRGGANNKNRVKQTAFLAIPAAEMRSMTLVEIAETVECSYSHASYLCSMFGREFRRLRGDTV